ncbi:MAG: hydrogenase [Clostridia bacterium]|nr:hydrogenase [Clostridia bacterium]
MSKHLSPDIRIPIEPDNIAIVRSEDKCVKCGQCRLVCRDQIAVGRLYDLLKTGDKAICIHCGQCANVCPVSSITERSEWEAVRDAVKDPEKIVVFSTSPAVRVGLGEAFGMAPGTFVEGKMVAALRALGGDYVLDTSFAADLTIMEEASELVERLTKGDRPTPQFTSCCPAWVRFVETFYPDFLPNLSTAKSPIGMQGPTIKTWFAQTRGLDPRKIVNVAVTPCTAKKAEIRRGEMTDAAGELGMAYLRDMDHVITTRELADWFRSSGMNWDELWEAEYDPLLSRGSGAGVIFGNTGGVMEAAVRTAHYLLTGENPPEQLMTLTSVRGMEGIREAELTLAGKTLRLAVVHGTENARQLLEKLKSGKARYDFVEVMTCPAGCIGGGGQPKGQYGAVGDSVRASRAKGLYDSDAADGVRLSHENPDIVRVYQEFYGKPLSPLAERLLHTAYTDRSADLG